MSRPEGETTRAYQASLGSPSNISPTNGSSHTDDGILSNLDFTFTNDFMTDDMETQIVGENAYPTVEVALDTPSLDEFLMTDGLLAYDDDVPRQRRCSVEVNIAPYHTLDMATQSWCGWMRRGMSLSAVTQSAIVPSHSLDATSRQIERPVGNLHANLLIQSL